MARALYLLFAFTVLAAWAGAQPPAAPAALSAEDKLRLMRANGNLVESLVRDGLTLARATNAEDRAAQCRGAALSLLRAIEDAAKAEDAERVAELAGLYREVVRDGLLPTISEAQVGVTPESPSGRKLRDLRRATTNDVTALKAALPAGKVADSPRVRDAVRDLEALTAELNR